MYLDSVCDIIRGWPLEGANETTEIIRQGAALQNGDLVTVGSDGTVDKVGATPVGLVGLVIRGNLDSASAANANGRFMTPQPVKTITNMAWANGVVTCTLAGHGYAVGQAVAIAGSSVSGTSPVGNQVITSVPDANTFTFALSTTVGTVTTPGTAQLLASYNVSGKAVVLWGNYTVKTTNYAAGAYVPGSPVTAKNGQFALATAASQSTSSPYTYTAGDPIIGYVAKVQGAVTGVANNGQTAHLQIVVA